MDASNDQGGLLGDYIQQQGSCHLSSKVKPTKGVEINRALVTLITTNQFVGLDQENPFSCLATFYELCGTLGTNSDDEEVVYLKFFSFSLIWKAKIWFQSHPNQSLTSWDDIERKFLARFFPIQIH